MSIAALLQAAEYIERRERGEGYFFLSFFLLSHRRTRDF